MSISAALQIGRSGLVASQAAIQVAGSNLANIATRGYHKQTITLAPERSDQIQQGVFIGRGVQVLQIVRQVDAALEGRLRTSIADQSGSLAREDMLKQIEAIQNEFSEIDLSSRLGAFFNAWSELANSPQDLSLRTLVVQQGQSLAEYVTTMRQELSGLRTQADDAIGNAAAAADDLLSRIATLNQQVVAAEQGNGSAHGLRDQRDVLLNELSQYLDISVNELPNGVVDVFVGSLPVILDGKSRGVELRRQTVDGDLSIEVVLKADGSVLDASSGKIGALVESRREDINAAIDAIDGFANALIFQINRVHSQGQGLEGYTSVAGTNRVEDTGAALNSDDAGLKFNVTHGSFEVHLTQKSTGQRNSETIHVDLDGLNGNDTTLASLAADLDALANISATLTLDGRLQLTSDAGDYEISFSHDSSGVLAALGVNTFFSGSDARDIAVNATVSARPALLAASGTHDRGDNSSALKLAALRDEPIAALGGLSLSESWNRHVEDFAVRLGQVQAQVEADTIVRESLEQQQQAVSGVNADEEAINLLAYQRAYQGSARFLTVVDEMLQTLLGLI